MLDLVKFHLDFYKYGIQLGDTDGVVCAINGKSVRISSTRKEILKVFVHMVSAWGCNHQLILGVGKGNEKFNEIASKP
jgi:hypothetical protein